MDKFSWTEWRNEKATRLLITVQNDGNDILSLGRLGHEFHKENLHFRGSNFGGWLNLVKGVY